MRASSQGVFGEQAKEALSEVEPRGVCGREVKVEPRSFGKPAFDRRRLVRGEIVEHDMDVKLARNGCFNLSEELLELYRSMSRIALSEDFTCCGVERSKQVSRSMPNVVVGLSIGLAQAHRQDRLSTLERLNLRFLVDAKYDRIVRCGSYTGQQRRAPFRRAVGLARDETIPSGAVEARTFAKCVQSSNDSAQDAWP